MTSTQDFLHFIDASPSSYHAAANVERELVAAGFQRQREEDAWDVSPGGHVVVRGGAVMAYIIPPRLAEGAGEKLRGFRIVGSHTDSPGFTVKPEPDFQQAGWDQIGVEVYGGPILHSWFDRELTLAGQVTLRDQSTHLVNTGPILRIPNLAIHMVCKDEFTPDRQFHLQPVWQLSANGQYASLGEYVAEQLGVRATDIAAFNLMTAAAEPAGLFGPAEEFIAAGRMDNLSSVHASLEAFTAAAQDYDGPDVLVMAAFDHEEIGSNSRYGAAGPILADILQRTAVALGATGDDLFRVFAHSHCVSADAAHSVHPNYAQKHDPHHQPLIGHGPVTKINGKQRYASDSESITRWENACRRAGVPFQRFVANNDVPCGSTIGPITATRLGIETVDIGVPMLSMHSAREMVGVSDQAGLFGALLEYLVG